MTAGTITALLGPTNTGKTHHAIERMLEHSSGMIGAPLRLLAREIYDRVTARVGEGRVALVTGEEQRVPARGAAYWIATVEAMPVTREVEFLAVDEVQLAAHRERGHVFTSRLLSARGTVETWFLGAETMGQVLSEIVPTAKRVQHPRLSRLSYAGATPLAKLPPRSAVVAFSMSHVYELAERVRKRRGGAAVVIGALSPRTRNAQVAMFQAGEVDCIVATDAIGMGLNLDVEHVAFAATRKFDGREVREVEDAELGQIAGRAGRWIHDGTFGTLSPLDLPSSTVRAIELHSFPRVKRVEWRSDDLDFASIVALRDSLSVRPTRGIFRLSSVAEDATCLALLANRDSVRRRATSPERVRLLWDVCTVPDFRKLMLEVHAEFLEELYVELVDHGRVRDDWIAPRMREIERGGGEVEELTARIAAVRTWTYVANRSTWLESPEDWQERTREMEDRLSDALHERLVLRFVDVKKGAPRAGRRARARRVERGPLEEAAIGDDDLHADPRHPFAQLASLRNRLASQLPIIPDRPGAPAWIQDVVDAQHADFVLEATGTIVHAPSKRRIGHLVRGGSIALPSVEVSSDDSNLGAGAKSRLQRRLLAFARDVVDNLVGGVSAMATKQARAPVRAFVHRLEQGLGTLLARDMEDLADLLQDAGFRAELAGYPLRVGTGIVYVPHALLGRALGERLALASTWYRLAIKPPPSGGAVSFVPRRGIEEAVYTAIGFPVVGPRAIRADVLDRVLTHAENDRAELASWIGAPLKDMERIVKAGSAFRCCFPSDNDVE